MYGWLTKGGRAVIKHSPRDPAIFPDCSAPPENELDDLQCDADVFRNDPGVEELAVTEEELQTHVDANYFAVRDTYEKLSEFVGAIKDSPVILNKIGLILNNIGLIGKVVSRRSPASCNA